MNWPPEAVRLGGDGDRSFTPCAKQDDPEVFRTVDDFQIDTVRSANGSSHLAPIPPTGASAASHLFSQINGLPFPSSLGRVSA
jgi:hypothetical protein